MTGFLDRRCVADHLTAEPPTPEDLKPGDLLAIRVTRFRASRVGYRVGDWWAKSGERGWFKAGLFLQALEPPAGYDGHELPDVRVLIDGRDHAISPEDIACVMARPR